MCEHCQAVETNHPGFAFCPYCGQELSERREVKEAVNLLSKFCEKNASHCETCLFYDKDSGGEACLFKDEFYSGPWDWPTY